MRRKKLIRFELTKVRRNVEKSYQTRWLLMHYSREKRCQHTTKIQRLLKYATTNLRRNVTRQNYSVHTCVRGSRTPFHKNADFLDDFSVNARNADIS